MQLSYSSLSIGAGKCRVKNCVQTAYRHGRCRPHYEQSKAKADLEVQAAARGIYFVYAVLATNGLVKIGISNTPERRFVALQTSSPLKLELLGYIPASPEIEKLLHKVLWPARSHGEWFHQNEAVLAAVEAIRTKDFDRLEAVLC